MANAGEYLGNELFVRYVLVDCLNRPDYTSKFNLQSVQVNMRCGYSTRNKMRWVILTDNNGDVLLPQTFLKYNKRVELGFLSNQYNLDYYLTLKPKNKDLTVTDDYDYLDWSNDFNMCFVGHDYKITEKMNLNLRKVFVGN